MTLAEPRVKKAIAEIFDTVQIITDTRHSYFLQSITAAMPRLVPAVELGDKNNEELVKYVQDLASGGDVNLPVKFFESVAALWEDSGVQAAFERSNEYQLIDCAQ
ncbi:unnamed protein product [Calicophoron daubneyi]|uniref:Uncharacterized protein n=1 Tax=Calicophoron daubneyi TaxID=300641 RepID=A0AAV2TI03_CALDB